MEINYILIGYIVSVVVALTAVVWRPQLILYLLILGTMFPDLADLSVWVGRVHIYVTDILFALFCLILGIVMVRRYMREEPVLELSSETKPLLLLVVLYGAMHVLFAAFALFKGVAPDSVIRRFLVYANFMYFFFPLFFFNDPKQIRILLYFLVIMALFFPLRQLYIFAEFGEQMRLTSSGTIRIAGGAASLVVACGLFAMFVWVKGFKSYAMAALPVASILFVGHRSALVALVISLMLLFIWTKNLVKPLAFAYITILFTLSTLFFAQAFTGHDFIGDTVKRASDTFDASNPTTVARLNAYKENIDIFKRNPVFGIGYYHEAMYEYNATRSLDSILEGHLLSDPRHVLRPHNFIFRFLSHTGLLGTSLIIVVIGAFLLACYRVISQESAKKNAGIFLFCASTNFLLMALMNTNFVTQGYIIWVLFGFIALQVDAERSTPKESIETGNAKQSGVTA